MPALRFRCRNPFAATAAALWASACAHAGTEAPMAAPPPWPEIAFAAEDPVFAPDTLKADFRDLYDGLSAAHYDLFAHRSKAEYDALFAEMSAGLDVPMTKAEAMAVFQRFAAFGNVAHSRIDFPIEPWRRFRDAGGKAFPIEPLIRDGRLYVGRSFPPGAALSAGDEILAIDGRPAAYWLERVARNVSADTPNLAHTQLELAYRVYHWLEAGEKDEFILRIKQRSGGEVSLRAAATTSAEEAAAPDAPATYVLDTEARTASLLPGGIAYLKPGPFFAVETPEDVWNPSDYLHFLDDAFLRFDEAGAKALLVDLRQNPGGDASFSDPLIARFADRPFRFASRFEVKSSAAAQAANAERLSASAEAADGVSGRYATRYEQVPFGETFSFEIETVEPATVGRFEGPVYVLIDRYSYSNAVTAAALIQDYGFGTVIGEATSDMATTYGAMERFTLPRTQIEVGFPKALIVRPSGDDRVAGVTPDIDIEAPLLAQEDVMLARAAALIRRDLSE